MTKQCNECKIQFEYSVCPKCDSDLNALDLDNPMDAFIANGGFGAAIEDFPESVVESLKEVC